MKQNELRLNGQRKNIKTSHDKGYYRININIYIICQLILEVSEN